ncbi:MAG: class I SAM-dependent methyltransferase [Desulfobacula sp.]|nr:class I SAM-dependent methyltransferase [Desulfobacula sp.]
MNNFKTQTMEKVQTFYNAMPFNFTDSVKTASKKILRQNAIQAYPNLHEILRKTKETDTVLDIGCGAGWFPNTLACHYQLQCVAVDFSETAVGRAREIAAALEVEDKLSFNVCDLFTEDFESSFFLVNSIGVLHHTHDCQAALVRISEFVRSGGYIHIALYHSYGRKPFLDYFSAERKRFFSGDEESQKEAEKKALEKYKELNSHIKDETLLLSWCRDQVFHPHETQHTLKEACEWLWDLDFSVISTSMNGFGPVKSWDALFEDEKNKESLSYQWNGIKKKYYPGFFSVLAQKNSCENSSCGKTQALNSIDMNFITSIKHKLFPVLNPVENDGWVQKELNNKKIEDLRKPY